MTRVACFAAVLLSLAALGHAEDEDGRPRNRLASERSPYLRQHAGNPMDWYPWGEAAFAKARAEDKPIFLSIGYAACHWCHVMEHESFEHAPTGRLLDDAFVCVKVDREERPDIDRLYMNAVIQLAGRGGWPMTVVLTPDRKPFWGGTYLSRSQTQKLARDMKRRWRSQRGDLLRKAEAVSAQLRQIAAGPSGARTNLNDTQLLQAMQDSLGRRYDRRRGGYISSKKFPPHGGLLYFLNEGKAYAGDADRAWVRSTLDAMADGGFHDHVGGGFHRYTVDSKWLVPHFEKMLYDNALLARAYAQAGTPRDRRTADRAFAWMESALKRPAGGYASSLDADTQGHEGTTYVWTLRDLNAALPAADRRFAIGLFGATRAGNFSEGFMQSARGRNILYLPRPLEAFARRSGMPKGQVLVARERVVDALLAARTKRAQPRLDEKVITSWNALLLSAFAAASWNPAYRARAEALATTLTTRCVQPDGTLLRFPRDSGPPIVGFCEDHAHLIDGLLDLDRAAGTARWLPLATKLGRQMLALFHDPEHGGFFTTSTARHEALIARGKQAFDSPIPSSNATATRVCLRLHRLTGEAAFGQAANRTLALYRPALATVGMARNTMSFARAVALRLQPAPKTPMPAGTWHIAASTRQDVFLVELLAKTGPVPPGGTAPIRVRLHVDFFWSVCKPGQKEGAPTRVQQRGPSTITLQGLHQVPHPKTREVGGRLGGVLEYEARLRVPRNTRVGAHSIVIEVEAQACDESTCRAPEKIELTLPVVVGHPGR